MSENPQDATVPAYGPHHPHPLSKLGTELVWEGKYGTRREVDVKLTQFLPSLAEVPSKELTTLQERAAKSGFDFIDFWAVDFDWHADKPFNHHWQDYRTRKDRSLKLEVKV